MSTQVGQVYPIISDKSGTPLDNGFVYIGESGQNPENYPIQIYYDEGFTIPAPQPLRTINGYFSRNGSPAKIFINAVECSIVVKDKFKILQWSDLNYTGILSGTGIKASDVQDASGKTQQEINNTNADFLNNVFKPYRSNFVFITDPLFGAVGDGSDESAKVQAALDYVGEYGTIYVPRGTFFVPQGLQLKRGQTIQGFGAQSSILQGDGSNVVIKTNSSVSGSIRYLRLLSLGIDNFTRNSGLAGNYAVQWWATNDSHIQMCEIKSRFQEALHVKYSYRGSITGNRITTSASAWAFALLNNCNGMDCSNNTISGGQAGGGVRVGMSQTLNLSNSVIEVAGTVAVCVGGDDGVDGGRCTGINLKGLYAEQCKRVLEAGLNFECYGIDIDGFIINQKSVSVIATYDEALHLGRVNGLFFQSGFAEGANQTAFIKLYDIAAGVGWTPYLSGSTLKSKAISGYLSPLFSFNGSTQSLSARIFGRNEIALNSDEIIGSEKEYISAPITCNIGYTGRIIVPPSTYGGLIQSVEIIEANASSGGISGTINIGSSSGATEVYTADLSTVTLTNGYAKVVAESAGKFIRATGVIMAVSVGTHTSSFRVRIKYRN